MVSCYLPLQTPLICTVCAAFRFRYPAAVLSPIGRNVRVECDRENLAADVEHSGQPAGQYTFH